MTIPNKIRQEVKNLYEDKIVQYIPMRYKIDDRYIIVQLTAPDGTQGWCNKASPHKIVVMGQHRYYCIDNAKLRSLTQKSMMTKGWVDAKREKDPVGRYGLSNVIYKPWMPQISKEIMVFMPFTDVMRIVEEVISA